MIIQEEPKFFLSEPVYHITPESRQGVVIDVRYSFAYKKYFYLVTFSHEESDWYSDVELSNDKTF